MKDMTGVPIDVGSRVVMFRHTGGGAIGKVVNIGSELLAVEIKVEVRPDLRQSKGWLTEQAFPQAVLVLK